MKQRAPASKSGLDAIIIGAAAMDMLAWVEHLPAKDDIVLAQRVEMQPGGSGANVAVAVARFGFKVGFIARISADENGQALLHGLSQEGVDTRACHIDPNLPTAICFIAIDSSGDRSMVALGGAGPIETIAELDPAYLAGASLVYLTDVQPPILRTTADIIRAQNCLLVFSPGGILASRGLEPLISLLPQVDVLLLSRTESHSLLPNSLPKHAAEELCALGARNVVITLGEQGVVCANPERSFSLPAFPVKSVVDTTGAGDAFAGGMLAGLLLGKNLEDALRYGIAAAAIKVGYIGARSGLPSWQQLEQFLSLYPAE